MRWIPARRSGRASRLGRFLGTTIAVLTGLLLAVGGGAYLLDQQQTGLSDAAEFAATLPSGRLEQIA